MRLRCTTMDHMGNVLEEHTLEDKMPEVVREVELPDWIKGKDGKLATFMPQLDTSRGQVHLLCPSGIGDVAWLWAKYWWLARRLRDEDRELIWHFPNDPHKRVDTYAKLVGMDVGEYLNIDIRELLEYPGEWNQEDFANGGVFYLHANRHIEHGKPLHPGCPKAICDCRNHERQVCDKCQQVDGFQTWHPWLPFKNPAPPVTLIHPGERPPQSSVNEGVWKWADPTTQRKYVAVHMASATYCEGNHFPRQWANLIEWTEKNIAPVRLIGAKWDEDFIDRVTHFYTPALPSCVGQSFATALTMIANSTAMIGVDSGLTIMATYIGLPALRCYPRWLYLMPGTFEDTETLHPLNRAIFMDELLDTYQPWLCEVKNW